MAKLQIFGIPQSNYVWATRIAAREKGVEYELLAVPPHSEEVRAVSPIGKIPAMKHGTVSLFESRAICQYIDECFEGPELMPVKGPPRWRAEQWVSLIQTTLEPFLVRIYAIPYLRAGDEGPDRAHIEPSLQELDQRLDLLEASVSDGALGGDHAFSLVDIFLAPILGMLRRFPESGAGIEARASLRAYADELATRPSVIATSP